LKWWIYGEKRPKLYSTIAGMGQFLVRTRVSKYHNFSFSDENFTVDQGIVCITFSSYENFTLLQNSFHEE